MPTGSVWSAEIRSGLGAHASPVTARLDELLHHCADLGLDVVYEDLSHLEHRGEWRWWSNEIALHRALTVDQMVAVLAHELGHVAFGDTCSTPAVERRAWEYGASMLITPEEYAAAESMVGPHLGALAKELGVTVRLIEGWRRWWIRRGKFLKPEHLRRLDAAEDESPGAGGGEVGELVGEHVHP